MPGTSDDWELVGDIRLTPIEEEQQKRYIRADELDRQAITIKENARLHANHLRAMETQNEASQLIKFTASFESDTSEVVRALTTEANGLRASARQLGPEPHRAARKKPMTMLHYEAAILRSDRTEGRSNAEKMAARQHVEAVKHADNIRRQAARKADALRESAIIGGVCYKYGGIMPEEYQNPSAQSDKANEIERKANHQAAELIKKHQRLEAQAKAQAEAERYAGGRTSLSNR